MNRTGRVVGMAIFALGILALIFVFGVAYRMFTLPAAQVLASPALTAAGIGSATVLVFVRIALLFVMTLAAALIASRGIQLYLGSGEHADNERGEAPPVA